jgi:bacterioferritin
MKGRPEILEVLGAALTDELGAVVQYILHAEMCDNWGYKPLAAFTKKRAIEEMEHAEKLIERILFLEGSPDVHSLPKTIAAGKDVADQFAIDLDGEQAAIVSYNQGITTCVEALDQGSANLLLSNLRDEERHADHLETQLGIIKELGLGNYLAQHLAGKE